LNLQRLCNALVASSSVIIGSAVSTDVVVLDIFAAGSLFAKKKYSIFIYR
jgi:hypothetical protein